PMRSCPSSTPGATCPPCCAAWPVACSDRRGALLRPRLGRALQHREAFSWVASLTTISGLSGWSPASPSPYLRGCPGMAPGRGIDRLFHEWQASCLPCRGNPADSYDAHRSRRPGTPTDPFHVERAPSLDPGSALRAGELLTVHLGTLGQHQL